MNDSNKNGAQLVKSVNSTPQIDLMEYWLKLWRRKWMLIGITSVITLAAAVFAMLSIKPVYEVGATIAIESNTLLNSSLGGLTGRTRDLDYQLRREQLLRKVVSPDYLNKIADKFNLHEHPRILADAQSYMGSASWITREDAMQRAILSYLRAKYNVSVSNRADQFHVAVQDTSPIIAYEMVEFMTNLFVQTSRQSDIRGIEDVKQFSAEQLAVYKRKLDQAEEKLREFNERTATESAKGIAISGETLVQLKNQKEETQDNLEQRVQRLALLENRIPKNVSEKLAAELQELEPLKLKVQEKKSDYERILSSGNSGGSAEMQLNNELNLLRLESNRIINRAIDVTFPKYNAEQRNTLFEYTLGNFDLLILKSRLDVISKVLNSTIKSAAAQPAINLERQKLEDEYEQHRRTYRAFLENSRGTQIQEAIQNTEAEFKYQIIVPPQMPIYPVRGSKKIFVLIAFAVSVALGVGLVIILEFLNQTIRSENDVENLNLTILGTIPKMNQSFEAFYREFRQSNKLLGKPSNGHSDAEISFAAKADGETSPAEDTQLDGMGQLDFGQLDNLE
ncbi:hypothetical protein JXA02_03615 [candidate division KSB1 bacterium]|nr:hypothetical protein [candidate division KSB1 bacterium]